MGREGERLSCIPETEKKNHICLSKALAWISLIFISGLFGTAFCVWTGVEKSHLFAGESKSIKRAHGQLHDYPFDWHFSSTVSGGTSASYSWPQRKVELGALRWQCIAIQVDRTPPLSATLLSEPLQPNEMPLNMLQSTCNLLPTTLKPLSRSNRFLQSCKTHIQAYCN